MLGTVSLFAADPSRTVRYVHVSNSDIVTATTQFGYTLLLELPEGEQVMDAIQPESNHFWSVKPIGSFVQVKALGRVGDGMPGQETNINVIAISGNPYTFLVKETSKQSGAFDLRVKLEQDDLQAKKNIEQPKYIAADSAQRQIDSLKRELEEDRKRIGEMKASGSLEAAQTIKHDYDWDHGKTAHLFGLSAIYHDDKFTYISATSSEAPALYEVKDDKPALIEYKLANGVYVVPHILDAGYLRIGKKQLNFKRKDS